MTTWKQVRLNQTALWPQHPWDEYVQAMLTELAEEGFGPGRRMRVEPEHARVALRRMAREEDYLRHPPTPAALIERAKEVVIEQTPRLPGKTGDMNPQTLERAREVYLAWAKKRTPQQLTEYHERVARYARFGMRGIVQLGRSQAPRRQSPPEPPDGDATGRGDVSRDPAASHPPLAR